MHELSIADAIVHTVLQEIERQHLPPVQKVVVRVGALSGVVPDALQFGFEAITAGTPLAQTILEIEPVPIQGRCNECEHTFPVEEFLFACPVCQSGNIQVTRGEELDIAYLEVETGL
jgi:hydrogenase nickel incorporation protein HypA/HybF